MARGRGHYHTRINRDEIKRNLDGSWSRINEMKRYNHNSKPITAEEAFAAWRISPTKHLKTAAMHPLHVILGAGMFAAGVFLSVWWLMVAAVVLYFALMYLKTSHDLKASGYSQTAEWQQSVMKVPTVMRMRLFAMIKMAGEINKDAKKMPYALEGIEDSTELLVKTIIQTAKRAADVEKYLNSISLSDLRSRYQECIDDNRPHSKQTAQAIKEQIVVAEELVKKREYLSAELEQLEASLGAVRARIAQAKLLSNKPVGVQQEIELLRERTRALAEGFGEMERVEKDLEDGYLDNQVGY